MIHQNNQSQPDPEASIRGESTVSKIDSHFLFLKPVSTSAKAVDKKGLFERLPLSVRHLLFSITNAHGKSQKKREESMNKAEKKIGNPAVVGLAAFALTTLTLQFHNVGWMTGLGPVVVVGLIFGGVAQLIAGFAEHKLGNNFGFSAFVAYGSFWISLALIFLFKQFGIFETTPEAFRADVGWFLVAWMIYTFVMLIASLRIHTAMIFTIFLLFLGFILLVIAHFVHPEYQSFWTVLAGFELMICAGSAMYMMLANIVNDQAGKTVLPFGKPWITT